MKQEVNRKVSVVEDVDGTKTVFIHDVQFRGRKKIDWKYVENYLKEYVGEFFTNLEYNDKLYIGTDLPDEFTGSEYTMSLNRPKRKAKANVIVAIPEIVSVATKWT